MKMMMRAKEFCTGTWLQLLTGHFRVLSFQTVFIRVSQPCDRVGMLVMD